jgi:DNA-binding transcriptional regulator/RsmH inhibitor MraZ
MVERRDIRQAIERSKECIITTLDQENKLWLYGLEEEKHLNSALSKGSKGPNGRSNAERMLREERRDLPSKAIIPKVSNSEAKVRGRIA